VSVVLFLNPLLQTERVEDIAVGFVAETFPEETPHVYSTLFGVCRESVEFLKPVAELA
jgi:hypothetical protein